MTKTICYRLKFIDSTILWQAHCQILLILLLKEFIKLNVRHDDKKSETFGIKYKDFKCFLQYENLI